MLAIITICAVYILNERHMDELQTFNPKTVPTSEKVGLIGDSWVDNQKLDKYIKESSGFEVVSYGFSGAKSRSIYRQLISGSANNLLTDESIGQIIIIAGVNDSSGHIGSDFYVHHIINIVSVINQYSKTPIILELPEYGIESPFKSLTSRAKATLFRFLFDKGEIDVIPQYRSALKSALDESGMHYRLIPFPIDDYSQNVDLYKNPWHLSDEGNKILGEYIGLKLQD